MSRWVGRSSRSVCASSAGHHLDMTQALENQRVIRPTVDDVQRLSEGRAAKTRGWGSRQVCHRLNADERKQYRLALEKGWLTLTGTGYRKERKGAPLANIYRQYCDANGMLCVNVLLAGVDSFVLVEASTLRRWQVDEARGLVVDSAVQREIRACMDATVASTASSGTVGASVEYLDGRALAGVVPWTVLAPPEIVENNTGEGLDAEIVEHFCSSAIWKIPVSVMGVRVSDRGLAKAIARDVSSRGDGRG
jgi:hypothetical protein